MIQENNNDLMKQDLDVIWHPCTQMKDHEQFPLIPIKNAKGVYLYDYEGNKYIDSISSWWVNIFGHSNDYINQKIKEQLDKFAHIIFAGFTHTPAITLAQRIVKLTPKGLDKVFFADNGSSGVEVALKMSFHSFKNKGEVKPYFLSLSNSYHGETLGALAVGDVELYKETYNEIMIKSLQTPVPKDQTKRAAIEAGEALEKILIKHKNKISSLILEPMVQCAGYMHMYHKEYLIIARDLCTKYAVHLIADEVAVGFGRTGKLFAIQHAGISPDFMILSKGLTGGYMPLSLVVTSNEIYQDFYCDYKDNKAFLHSHSYTGNALSCSAANATLDIFEKENIIENLTPKIEYFKEKTQKFIILKNVESVRQVGMIIAITLKGYDPALRTGRKIYDYALTKGVFLRPLGDVVYFMTPYTITYEEIDQIIDVAYKAIVLQQ
jgi:adenosylmethionine-8-amino-7-oxononanoate aminotransferase